MPLKDFVAAMPDTEPLLFTGDALSAHEAEICRLAGDRAVIAPVCARDIDAGAACALAMLSEKIDGMALKPIYLSFRS